MFRMRVFDYFIETIKSLIIVAKLVIGGTYGNPAHDISFEGLNFVSGTSSTVPVLRLADQSSNTQHG